MDAVAMEAKVDSDAIVRNFHSERKWSLLLPSQQTATGTASWQRARCIEGWDSKLPQRPPKTLCPLPFPLPSDTAVAMSEPKI